MILIPTKTQVLGYHEIYAASIAQDIVIFWPVRDLKFRINSGVTERDFLAGSHLNLQNVGKANSNRNTTIHERIFIHATKPLPLTN
jgi:hypothetical protein